MVLKYDRLKESLFCNNLRFVRFRYLQSTCCVEDCTCSLKKKFDSLFDLYAYLYFYFDNSHNLTDYYSIAQHEPDFYELSKNTRKQLRESFKDKVNEIYDSYSLYTRFDDGTLLNLITEDILLTKETNELILHVFNWIIVIDEFIGELLQETPRMRMTKFPLHTRFGVLILKTTYSLGDYVGDKKNDQLVNTDYMNLKNQMTSVCLTNNKLDVVYHELPRSYFTKFQELSSNMGGIKISFVTGIMKSLDQYHYEITKFEGEEINFEMKGILYENYESEMSEIIDAAIHYKPDLLILPELSATVDFQNRIINQIINCNINTVVIPGSFHTYGRLCKNENINDDYNYNYSKVFFGKSNNCADVYKMNPFRIIGESKLRGELEVFNNAIGIEKVDYYKRLNILETPIGKISFLICVDLLIDQVENELVNNDVKIVFVMAMTQNPLGGQFSERMKRLGRKNNICVFICNNPSGLKTKKDTIAVYFPIRDGLFGSQETPLFNIRIDEMIV